MDLQKLLTTIAGMLTAVAAAIAAFGNGAPVSASQPHVNRVHEAAKKVAEATDPTNPDNAL